MSDSQGRKRDKLKGLIRRSKSSSGTSSESGSPDVDGGKEKKRDKLKRKLSRSKTSSSGSGTTTSGNDSDESESSSSSSSAKSDKSKAPVKKKSSSSRFMGRFSQKKDEESTETPVVSSADSGGEKSGQTTSGTETSGDDEGGSSQRKTSSGGSKRGHSSKKADDPNVPDLPAATEVAVDETGVKEFQVRVRVIEGKELEGGVNIHPLCRIYLEGKIRNTKRCRATDCPSWNQNFYFNLKSTVQELPQKSLEFKIFSARKVLKDSMIGAFKCDLGMVYNQKDHAIIGRWVTLSGVEDDGSDTGVAGFLRISACVLAPGQPAPDLKNIPDSTSDEVMFSGGAHFRNMVLHIRIMELVDLPALKHRERRFLSNKEREEEAYNFVVEAAVGNQTATTRVTPSTAPQVYQEIHICSKWPTVAKVITLRLYAVRGKGLIPLGSVDLKFTDISSPENEGYLPCFGPAFLTFYGSHTTDRRALKKISKGREQAASFHGRIMVEIFSTQTETTKQPEITDLDSVAYRNNKSSPQSTLQKYILFCNFYAGNCIAKQYKNDNVYFEVSIGAYGNSKFSSTHPSSSRTPAVLPQYDQTTYYAMPWGSKKPCAVIPSMWEQYSYRLEATNVLSSIAAYITKEAHQIRQRIGSTEDADLASEFIKVIESVISTLVKKNLIPKAPERNITNTELDMRLGSLRDTRLNQIVGELLGLRDRTVGITEAVEILLIYASQIERLSVDPQGNIPDIIIWMYANGRPVAYGRIPPNRVLYSDNTSHCGPDVGRMVPVFLHSVEKDVTGLNAHRNPAVLQVIVWFGKVKERKKWAEVILPGEMKQFAESFENQVGRGRDWTASVSKPPPFSDEDGKLELPKDKFNPPEGWTWKEGKWFVSRTYDVWVDKDAGFEIFEEEVYELSKKNQKLDTWEVVGYTDFDGESTETPGDSIPDGWEWRDQYWKVDRNCPGDDDGFVYHVEKSWYRGFDCTERIYHLYRRRRWVRRRVFRGSSGTGNDTDDEKVTFRRGDSEGWEYSTKFQRPTHLRQRYEDRFRRRRWHRELFPNQANHSDRMFTHMSMRILQERKGVDVEAADAAADIAFRTVISYDKVHRWQLRAYIFQARDLCPVLKVGKASTYARVVFMNRSMETQIVLDSVNPIWQQTMIFEKVLLPGSPNKTADSPPIVMVEVFHDMQGLPPKFLGRCIARPTVATVNKLRDGSFERCKLQWISLETEPDRFRGDILAAFELYEADHVEFIGAYPGLKNAKELEDAKKERGKPNFLPPKPIYEVPVGIRPEYQEVNIDFLCWGVRNLRRYQLTAVKRPFVELIVSNRMEHTQPIQDVEKNPNFDNPIIHLRNVLLPRDIAMSAPITICLRDSRSFGRKPQVGMCLIKDFRKYLTDPPTGQTADKEGNVEDQMASGTNLFEMKVGSATVSGKELVANWMRPNFDWWSKYYASCGEGHADDQNAYTESGYEHIVILPYPLEEVTLYKGFQDFCDTFTIYKVARVKASDPEYTEFAGELKARLFLYKKEEGAPSQETSLASIPGLEFQGPTACTVRVYVVRALELLSRRKDGRVDSYVEVRLGKHKKQKSKQRVHYDNLEPQYGEIFEFQNVVLPQDKDLRVTIKDHHLLTADEEIGSTTVDLENRLLTKFRATVGIPNQFHREGINVWRDQQSPWKILTNYCRVHHLPMPSIHGKGEDMFIRLGNQPGYLEFKTRDMDTLQRKRDWRSTSANLGNLKQQLSVYVLRRLALVPEHIETRILENTLNPGTEQGKLHLWVDIFPNRYGAVPPPVNIAPRQAMPMQLRVIIWNLRDVILEDRKMGELSADLFVKCTLNGVKKSQKTDIHYRSLDGSGSFNWRMIFNFDYNPWDKEIVSRKRSLLFWRKQKAERMSPELKIQIFDNHKFRSDSFLGEAKLNLLQCENSQVDSDFISNIKKATGCCGGRRPSARSSDKMSLFQQKRVKGWWPTSRSQSDDITGKVELEIHLLPMEAAEQEPVGIGRKDPNMNPVLPKPDRPLMDRHWLTSRFKAFNHSIWKNWKWYIIIGIVVVLILLVLFAVLWHLPAIINSRTGGGGSNVIIQK